VFDRFGYRNVFIGPLFTPKAKQSYTFIAIGFSYSSPLPTIGNICSFAEDEIRGLDLGGVWL